MPKSLTVRLDDELAAQVERVGVETGLSRGRLVRDALRGHLAAKRSRRFKVMAEYKGAAAGPSDLSTNKKHLAAFGRSRRS